MRTPKCFTPPLSREPPPAPYQSIRFVACQRCMSHGQFVTEPADETPFVTFAQEDARAYVGTLYEAKRISGNQFWGLLTQITHSGLPERTSRAVEAILAGEMAWWSTIAEMASIGQALPVRFKVYGVDVADVIHRKVLAMPGNEHLLRLQ